MTDRERIARAMHESLRADPRWADMEPFDPEYHKQYLWQATAALDAMLEPSEGAWEAWRSVNCKNGEPVYEFTRFEGDYGNWLACHQAMIRYMREEKDG